MTLKIISTIGGWLMVIGGWLLVVKMERCPLQGLSGANDQQELLVKLVLTGRRRSRDLEIPPTEEVEGRD